MEIYLVRHGETGGNVAHRHQANSTPLSYIGINQAKEVAEVLCSYKPTHLISSSLVRAVETARVIGEVCNMVPETSTKFIELERPSFLYGRKHRSPSSLWFYFRWYLGLTNGLEGESYKALRARIEEAKAVLAKYPDDARIIIVTHSVFMNLFLVHLCRTRPISPVQAVFTFLRILRIKNTHLDQVCYRCEIHRSGCEWARHK